MTDKGIIAAAAIIALALAFTNHYSISSVGTGAAYRVNTLTGSISLCYPPQGCKALPEN